MHHTHTTSRLPSSGTSRIRTVFGNVMGVVAVLMTLYLGWGVYDAITGEYIGGEVDAIRVVLGLGAVLTILAWVGAVALVKSGSDRSRHSELLTGGLWTILVGAIGVNALSLTPLWVPALGVVVVGLLLAVIGVVRM